MRAVIVLLALALVGDLPPTALAQDPRAAAPFVLVEDAAGDAVEAGPAPTVLDLCPDCPVPEPAHSVGVPAPPSMDLLGLTVEETPTELVFSFQVASLDEALTGMVSDEGRGRGAQFGACWEWANANCNAGINFYARRQGGATFLGATYGYLDDACNTRAICGWGVPYELEYGSPGAIHLRVPRALHPAPAEPGNAIGEVVATVGRLTSSPAMTMTPGPPLMGKDTMQMVDVAGPGPTYALELARAEEAFPYAPSAGFGPGLLVGGDPLGGVDAEADILDLTLVETPATLTFSFRFAAVSDAPRDQRLGLEFAFLGGRYHNAEVSAFDQQRTLQTRACEPSESVGCDTSEPIPGTLEIAPGAPGFVNVTYLRGDLGAPPAGAFSTRVVGGIIAGEGVRTGAVSEHDLSGLLPPFTLRFSTRADEVPPGAYRLDDAPADARAPGFTQPEDASGAEVLHAQAELGATGGARLTLALRDPARTAIPLGYSALVRAIAMEEADRTTLVAAYRDASGESYFCASDTLVLSGARALPPPQARMRVVATVAAGEAGGNITFDVAPECLGAPGVGGERAVRRLGAGSYLVRGAGVGEGEVVVVDEAIGSEAFVLAPLAAAPVAPAPAPFPWTLALLALAGIVLVGVAVPFALLRRRKARALLPAPGALFLGRYLVDREIGRGGFGAVWLATHTKLGRRVVIKQLHPGWAADPKAVERFRREARLLAKLDHPHVVKVYDAEEVDGHAFLVMEYVEGGTLADLRPKPAPLPGLARIGSELLDALCAIHAAGVVHGDLKPDNVLLASDRTLRIADFGIARPVESAPAMRTMAYGVGEPLGTPLFMAPEQLDGEPPGPASDLYASAAIVHHVATGRLLFTPAPMDVESARLAHARGAPDAGEDVLHPALVSWLRRGLARDPRDRFSSADEMREAWRVAVGLAREA